MNGRIFFVLLFVSIMLGYSLAASCGDGSCEAGENSCNCSDDCGKCSGDVPTQACKEYGCDGDVCRIVSVPDCCGNRTCEQSSDYHENYGNCPSDCTPKEITVEITSPDEEFYTRGESVLFKVRIAADGRAIASPDVNAEGFFGTLELFNDGKHGDDLAWDNVFAESYTIESYVAEGIFPIFVQTAFLGIDGNNTIDLEIRPRLDVELKALQQYSLGQIIEISGTINKKGKAMALPVDVNIVAMGKTVFEKTTESDSNGFFSLTYHISLLDPASGWVVGIYAVDGNKNYVSIEEGITVTEPVHIKPLNIEFVSQFTENYNRGEEITFIIKLVDEEKQLVENAKVMVELPGGESISLSELQPGTYSGIYVVGYSLPAGLQEFTVRASGTLGGASIEETKSLELLVESVELEIEITAPNKLSYAVGERMEIRLNVKYPDGEPANNAEVKVLIGGEETALTLTELGTYTGSYTVKEGDEGRIRLFFSADDGAGNKGLSDRHIEISGKLFWHDFMQNLWAFAIGFIIIAAGAIVAFVLVSSKNKLVELQRKKGEIEANQKRLQKSYFDESGMDKEEFMKLTDKYEKEISEVKAKIRRLKKK